jgi:hypothetical protein
MIRGIIFSLIVSSAADSMMLENWDWEYEICIFSQVLCMYVCIFNIFLCKTKNDVATDY